MTVIGHNATTNEFLHAVLMTKCIRNKNNIAIKLKNSLEGEHLEGNIDLKNPYATIKLNTTKKGSTKYSWKMDCFDACYVQFV